jgi:hypothetical protein
MKHKKVSKKAVNSTTGIIIISNYKIHFRFNEVFFNIFSLGHTGPDSSKKYNDDFNGHLSRNDSLCSKSRSGSSRSHSSSSSHNNDNIDCDTNASDADDDDGEEEICVNRSRSSSPLARIKQNDLNDGENLVKSFNKKRQIASNDENDNEMKTNFLPILQHKQLLEFQSSNSLDPANSLLTQNMLKFQNLSPQQLKIFSQFYNDLRTGLNTNNNGLSLSGTINPANEMINNTDFYKQFNGIGINGINNLNFLNESILFNPNLSKFNNTDGSFHRSASQDM